MTQSRARPVHRLSDSDRPLVECYDLAMLDLDGVVYVGADAVPGAAEALSAVRPAQMRLAYITNNASRPPAAVVRTLLAMGMPVTDGEVVTSAQAAARLVADLVPAGAAVLVVGGEGLRAALAEHGLRSVASLDDGPAAVVQGFAPTIDWKLLAEGAYAVAAGLPWVASNTDATIPTARGIAPGNGTLVDAVARATGSRPVVAGKPEAPLFEETLRRVGGTHPIVVGDRLDTDILGANTVAADSLLVLTGVSGLADVLVAPPEQRPTYLAADLAGLHVRHRPVELEDDGARCGDVVVRVREETVEVVSGAGEGGNEDTTALLRATVALGWSRLDDSGSAPAVDAVLKLLKKSR